jgi:glutathione-regulated potassium-efflux system ancillary protein KefG
MSEKNRILILFAHPAMEKSRINRSLAHGVKDIPGVTFRDLYEIYPDLHIDVNQEQRLLTEHDVILFQHPFYWYSTPALLKEWMDLVLEYGWAYGEKGNRLEGKAWIHAISTGGPKEAYDSQGYNRFSIRQLLAPLDQTAHLCGMYFLPPFVIHGALKIDPTLELPSYVDAYRKLVTGLRDWNGPWEKLETGDLLKSPEKSHA